jgi:lipopolysaccharide export system permease protein
MGILERYIFRTAFSAFLLCLIALTAVIWLTSALRELDLVTGKGQTIAMFLYLTALSLPALVMVITPLALFLSIMYALNKLNGDSELIVMSAAGVSPGRILRPFLLLTLLATGLVGYITVKVMPDSFRELRNIMTKIRADVVTQFIQEGKFINLDQGVTFHYREKAPNGTMLGILFQDRRDTKDLAGSANEESGKGLVTTYLAERGRVAEIDDVTYFILEKGSFQRQDKARKETALVYFERYAIDLDQMTGGGDIKIVYKPRERTTWDLWFAKRTDADVQHLYGRFRAELHERFSQPLYGLATLAIAFAALGSARTTRQGRGTAIAGAAVAMVLLRIAGFSASSLAIRTYLGVILMYAVPLAAAVIAGAYAWWSQTRPDVLKGVAAMLTSLSRRIGQSAFAQRLDPVALGSAFSGLRRR